MDDALASFAQFFEQAVSAQAGNAFVEDDCSRSEAIRDRFGSGRSREQAGLREALGRLRPVARGVHRSQKLVEPFLNFARGRPLGRIVGEQVADKIAQG